MSGPLLRAEALARWYPGGGGRRPALAGVSLEVAHGEMLAVTGPSGSGKTTLLNLLGCLDRPSSGQCYLEGRRTSDLGADALADIRNRRLGMVFQAYNLLPRLTALENVALPLLYAGLPPALRRRRAARALGRVGLADLAGRRPGELSGGQQQRVALARALVNAPVLLLADEPTGAVDSRTGALILALLRELNRSGIAVILVTHNEAVAARFPRRLVLADGRLVADLRPPGAPGAGS